MPAQHRQELIELHGLFAVCKRAPDAEIPAWAMAGDFFSITRTREELSIVCAESAVPADVACERGWRCLRVAGALPFTAVGVLASLAAPLAEAGISIFAVSTHDTDYLFVQQQDFTRAVARLTAAGHAILP